MNHMYVRHTNPDASTAKQTRRSLDPLDPHLCAFFTCGLFLPKQDVTNSHLSLLKLLFRGTASQLIFSKVRQLWNLICQFFLCCSSLVVCIIRVHSRISSKNMMSPCSSSFLKNTVLMQLWLAYLLIFRKQSAWGCSYL